MKVIFLYPEVYEYAHFGTARREMPPFGVMCLAAVLEEALIETRIAKVTPEHPTQDLSGYDAICFSIPSSATYNLMLACRQGSIIDPQAKILVGGLHASVFAERVLRDFRADCLATGEADETILAIVTASDMRDYESIPGVWFNHESPRYTGLSAPPADLNRLPLPARHLLPADDLVVWDRLARLHVPTTHVLMSRGCPFQCRFCANQTPQLRYYSGERARAELTALVEQYAIEGFCITDDNFIVDRAKVTEICEAIAPLGLRWSALARVDAVGRDLLATLRNAGCVELKFGIESGSQFILDRMGKNTQVASIRAAIAMTHEAGIGVKAFLVHGFPGENLETTEETIKLLTEMRREISRVSVFRFVPLPGSYVFGHPLEFALRSDLDSLPWGDFHLYNNSTHWWGTSAQFDEMEMGYAELARFVDAEWPSDLT